MDRESGLFADIIIVEGGNMNDINMCLWTISLASLFPGKKGVEVSFRKSDGVQRICGVFSFHTGKVMKFEIFLTGEHTHTLKPFLAVVSDGPRSRNYYLRQEQWSTT